MGIEQAANVWALRAAEDTTTRDASQVMAFLTRSPAAIDDIIDRGRASPLMRRVYESVNSTKRRHLRSLLEQDYSHWIVLVDNCRFAVRWLCEVSRRCHQQYSFFRSVLAPRLLARGVYSPFIGIRDLFDLDLLILYLAYWLVVVPPEPLPPQRTSFCN